jgi:hypothetical protein
VALPKRKSLELTSPRPDASDCVRPRHQRWKMRCRRRIFAEKSRPHLLEVSVAHRPPRWEWELSANGEMIANGFEREETAAKFEGYNAMFLVLAAGWR